MSRRTRKFLTFVACALTAAAIITLAQAAFAPDPGQDQRALLMPSPR
ncbi:hypothetical protein [Parvibaculum sp.]|jgi:hypothetical protein|nr:hypothetical protein [Parvibaculum sp.]